MEPMLNAIRPTGQKAATPDAKPVDDPNAAAFWAETFAAESGKSEAIPEAEATIEEAPIEELIDEEPQELELSDQDVADDSEVPADMTAYAAEAQTKDTGPKEVLEKGPDQRRVGAREALTQLSKPETIQKASEAPAANLVVDGAPTSRAEHAGLSPLAQQISQLARTQSGKNTKGDGASPAALVAGTAVASPTSNGSGTVAAEPLTDDQAAKANTLADLGSRLTSTDSAHLSRDRNIVGDQVIAAPSNLQTKPKVLAKDPAALVVDPLDRPGSGHLHTAAPEAPRHTAPLVDAGTMRTDPAAASVSRQITAAITPLREGVTEVRLTPEELGRVRMTVSTVDGALHIAIAADRPETADLMRRSLDQLRQDLNDMGYSDAEIDLQQGQQDQNEKSDQKRDWTNTRTVALAETEATAPQQRRVVSDRLDLRL